jgi:hypothetical protein
MLENGMFSYGSFATIFVICNKTFMMANDFIFFFSNWWIE